MLGVDLDRVIPVRDTEPIVWIRVQRSIRGIELVDEDGPIEVVRHERFHILCSCPPVDPFVHVSAGTVEEVEAPRGRWRAAAPGSVQKGAKCHVGGIASVGMSTHFRKVGGGCGFLVVLGAWRRGAGYRCRAAGQGR